MPGIAHNIHPLSEGNAEKQSLLLDRAKGWYSPVVAAAQEGIMPLLRFLSAMARRLWLALVLLFASFFLRSCTVSRFCPWPLAFPTTAELLCLYLGHTEKGHHNRRTALLGTKSQIPTNTRV